MMLGKIFLLLYLLAWKPAQSEDGKWNVVHSKFQQTEATDQSINPEKRVTVLLPTLPAMANLTTRSEAACIEFLAGLQIYTDNMVNFVLTRPVSRIYPICHSTIFTKLRCDKFLL